MKKYNLLVDRSFKVNKKRNIIIIIGIILGMILFTTVGYVKEYNKEIEILKAMDTLPSYEAIIRNASSEDIEVLKNNIYTNNVGVFETVEDKAREIIVCQGDEIFYEAFIKDLVKISEGTWPKYSNEVVFNQIGKVKLNKKIGETIIIGNKEYKIVGYFEDSVSDGPGYINGISILGEEKLSNINLAFDTVDGVNKKEGIESIAKAFNKEITTSITNSEFIVNSHLLYSYGIDFSGLIKHNILIEFVLYFGILVLTTFLTYGAIDISIKERINQFTFLKCIGATQSKISIMLLKETLYLGVFSIIPGIIISQGVAYVIASGVLSKMNEFRGYELSFKIYPNIIVLTTILTMVNIVMATAIPIIKLSNISPIQSQNKSNNKKIIKRKAMFLRKFLGFDWSFSYKNMRANNRTFIINSMVAGIILTFLLVIHSYTMTLINGYKYEETYTKDAYIGIETNEEDILSQANKYKKELLEVGTLDKVYSTIDYSLQGLFDGIDGDEKKGEVYKILKDGSREYLFSNKIKLLILDDESINFILQDNKGSDIKLEDLDEDGVLIGGKTNYLPILNRGDKKELPLKKGDTFTLLPRKNEYISGLSMEDELISMDKSGLHKKLEFKYLGDINKESLVRKSTYQYSNNIVIIASKKYYEKNKEILNSPNLGNCRIDIITSIKDGVNKGDAMEDIKGVADIYKGHFINNIEDRQSSISEISGVVSIGYLIIILTSIIGGINIINNKIMHIKGRKDEIDILYAIGMKRKRLEKILFLEGFIQWIISTIIGIGLSIIILIIIYNGLYFSGGVRSLYIPYGSMIVGSILILIINVIGIYIGTNKVSKEL
ncbi:MAG: ABC transporter permease [Clostridium sp.]